MAYQDPQLLYLDRVLTSFSVGFQNADLVAEALAPVVTVDQQSGKYNIFERGNSWRSDWNDLRGPGGKANEIPKRKLSRDGYFAVEHALMDVVPPEEQQAAATGDVDRDPLAESTMELSNMILMGREQKVVDMATTAANYNSSNVATLSGGSQWDNYGSSTPIADIKAANRLLHGIFFTNLNTAIMGWLVASYLEDHPTLITRIQYSALGVTTDQLIAELTGIPQFKRAGAGKLTNRVGQTETVGYMWGKDVVFANVPDRPGRRTPAFMYEFNFPFQDGLTMPTERWYDNDRKADKVRVTRRYDVKFISLDSSGKAIGGYLIKNAIS